MFWLVYISSLSNFFCSHGRTANSGKEVCRGRLLGVKESIEYGATLFFFTFFSYFLTITFTIYLYYAERGVFELKDSIKDRRPTEVTYCSLRMKWSCLGLTFPRSYGSTQPVREKRDLYAWI
jgi:hypothetical protein